MSLLPPSSVPVISHAAASGHTGDFPHPLPDILVAPSGLRTSVLPWDRGVYANRRVGRPGWKTILPERWLTELGHVRVGAAYTRPIFLPTAGKRAGIVPPPMTVINGELRMLWRGLASSRHFSGLWTNRQLGS
jgi:hypothetical protein